MGDIWMPILLYLGWVGLNSLFEGFIKRSISHPKYNLPIAHDDIYGTLVLMIGFPIILFRKRIIRKRIRNFVEYVEAHKKSLVEYGVINGVMYDIKFTMEQYEEMHRYLKLEELKKKIKKKKWYYFRAQ